MICLHAHGIFQEVRIFRIFPFYMSNIRVFTKYFPNKLLRIWRQLYVFIKDYLCIIIQTSYNHWLWCGMGNGGEGVVILQVLLEVWIKIIYTFDFRVFMIDNIYSEVVLVFLLKHFCSFNNHITCISLLLSW